MTFRPAFRRSLNKLERKHQGTRKLVEDMVSNIADHGLPKGAMLIPGLQGQPVYKMRIRIGKRGKIQGRLICYCQGNTVEPLFVYFKGDKSNVSPDEIMKALRTLEN